MHRISAASCVAAVMLALASAAQAQTRPATIEYKLHRGQVSFRAPTRWHLIKRIDEDSASAVIFHVRNPATDTGAARANVLVSVFWHSPRGDFRAQTDTLFNALFDGGAVLGDTMPAPSRRFLFWRGQAGEMPYAIFDDFGRNGAILVHVRMALPMAEGTTAQWNTQYSADTERLLASIRVGGAPLFPGWAGHPELTTFGP